VDGTRAAAKPGTPRRLGAAFTDTSILLLAGDTDDNLGDLAIVTAVCAALRAVDPGLAISLASTRPERDRAHLAAATIPRRWRGLSKLARAARNADLIICGGGGLLQDDDSLLKVPYWGLRLAALRLLNGRIAGLAIGAGPLDHAVSRVFARLALTTMQSVSVRDPLAKAVLDPLTRKPVELVPDPAFLLEPAEPCAARTALEGAGMPLDGKPLIGVALRRLFHLRSNLVPHKYAVRLGLGRKRGTRQMSVLTEDIASLLDELVAAKNAHVVFMPTYNVRHENDLDVCKAVAARMRTDAHTILQLDDPKLYKAVTGLLTVMLCGRMHAAILAAGLGTPIVGLAYNPKFQGTFSMFGQRDRCISAADFVQYRQRDRLFAMLAEAIDAPDDFRPDTTELAAATRLFIHDLLTGSSTDRGKAGIYY
jgi:polysaccharide pyruvyl transferase WcaK-like protein